MLISDLTVCISSKKESNSRIQMYMNEIHVFSYLTSFFIIYFVMTPMTPVRTAHINDVRVCSFSTVKRGEADDPSCPSAPNLCHTVSCSTFSSESQTDRKGY